MFSLLPPASQGWGKVLFSVCLSVHISGGVPQSGLGGVPHPKSGGYPIPGLDGVPPSQTWDGVPPPRPGTGYPRILGWGTPPDLGRGTLPPPDLRWGTPPPTWDIASTCYAVGGMPLAFTQEDFLVKYMHTFSLVALYQIHSQRAKFFPTCKSQFFRGFCKK